LIDCGFTEKDRLQVLPSTEAGRGGEGEEGYVRKAGTVTRRGQPQARLRGGGEEGFKFIEN